MTREFEISLPPDGGSEVIQAESWVAAWQLATKWAREGFWGNPGEEEPSACDVYAVVRVTQLGADGSPVRTEEREILVDSADQYAPACHDAPGHDWGDWDILRDSPFRTEARRDCKICGLREESYTNSHPDQRARSLVWSYAKKR